MLQRMDVSTVAPDLYKVLLRVEQHLRDSVEPALFELIKLRASMVNGCAFCVDMHAHDALERGERIERLFGLAAWHDAPWYSDAERAALALTDAVTNLGPGGAGDDVWEQAAAQFDDRELAELLGAIGMINLWNRIAVPTRSTPLSARSR